MFPGEIRQALRTLVRHRGYSTVAVLTLALGIGANTAIFSAVWRLFIAPLPFAEADRLVDVFRSQKGGGFMVSPDPEVVLAWKERARAFEGLHMWHTDEQTLTGSGEAAVLHTARVEPGLADFLGVEPIIGRGFTDEDVTAGGQVAVLSESLWRARFGAQASALGQTLRLNGELYTIIGVMPSALNQFNGTHGAEDVFLPLDIRDAGEFASVLARLRPGVTIETAQAELLAIAAPLPGHARIAGEWVYALNPATDLAGAPTRRALGILFGAVGIVLLIGCANVAGLLLVRLHVRRREIGVRAALGGARSRILTGIALEQLFIAAAAGVLGVVIAAWSIDAIRLYRPDQLNVLDTIALEGPVLGFAGLLVVLTSALFGVLPAAFMLRGDLTEALRPGAAGARVTDSTRMRSVLVAGEIALSVMLVVGALLLIRTFMSLQGEELGFEPAGALTVELALPTDRYPDGASREAFFASVLEGVRAISSVEAASVAGGAPPEMGIIFGSLRIEGADEPVKGIRYLPGTVIGPGYFNALGARIRAGRDFTGGTEDANAVIVNRALAERFWPDGDAVGKRISVGEAPFKTIVGVIDDMRVHGPRAQRVEPQMFVPIDWTWPLRTLVVRTSADDPTGLVPLIRQATRRIDADVPIRQAQTLTTAMAGAVARERFSMLLLAFFAGLAVVLTAVGLYGLINYTLQQRTREIGIRVALGASPANVQSQFVAQGARLTVVGLILGLVGATASVTVLRSMLFGVVPYDGGSFAAAVMLIGVATLLASWIPARRASRVDPLVALQSE